MRRRLQAIVVVCAGGALISLAVEFGFRHPPLPIPLLIGVQVLALTTYSAFRVFGVWAAGNRVAALRACWLDGVLLIGGAIALFAWFEFSQTRILQMSTAYIATMQGVLLMRLGIAALQLNLALSQSRLHPTRVLAITFVSLIVVGALLLALPKATTAAVHLRPDFTIAGHLLNCVFTATSATCVTGLAVYDTGSDFTTFGQCVILTLIQAGGLGIMIFGSVLGLLVGRQLSLQQSLALQDSLSHRILGEVRHAVLFILIFTLAAEAIGAAMLFPMWPGPISPERRLFLSVFHAVSAFCNAGFSLQTDSLISLRRSLGVYTSMMPLIVVGGLGFPVLRDLWSSLTMGLRRWRGRRRGWRSRGTLPGSHRLSLHSKIVLTTSGLLIVVPAICFVLFESFHVGAPAVPPSPGGMMRADPWWLRGLDGLFLSVTCRTAGFNTVAMDGSSLSPASHLLGAILMFIGGSPSSTAGGIKTVAFAAMALSVLATLRGRSRVEAWGRTIPEFAVRRASVVVMLMFALVSVVTLSLCVTEGTTLRAAIFESVSACGTVGLSMGITSTLTAAGRVAIIIAMFAGRLGPLTMLIALAGRSSAARYDYPREDVGIG